MAGKVDRGPALIINAGGRSRRMGAPKALLPVPPDDRPLIAHIYARLHTLCPAGLVVVTNVAGGAATMGLPPHACFVADRYPAAGPLGGIATGLALCSGWALVVACDLPFVEPALFRFLLTQAGDQADAVVPGADGRWQPLHALYHRRAIGAIEQRLAAGDYRIRTFLGDVRTRWVTEAELAAQGFSTRSFVNVNTPADWEAARRRLAGSLRWSPSSE